MIGSVADRLTWRSSYKFDMCELTTIIHFLHLFLNTDNTMENKEIGKCSENLQIKNLERISK
jgi:hypothetical protein